MNRHIEPQQRRECILNEQARGEYRPPKAWVVGRSAALVRGGGGLSGLDKYYYYYYLPNE